MESVLTSPELLSHIFSFLNFNTIKSVRCVSRFWKQQSEYFKFWKGVKLELDEYKKVKKVSNDLLNIISCIKIFNIDNSRRWWEENEKHANNFLCLNLNSKAWVFNEYFEHSITNLRDVPFFHIPLTLDTNFLMSKKLLSIIPRLNILSIEWCKLSSYQLTSIYRKIRNLQLLILDDDHRDVPADLLALSLTKVKKVKLEYANLSTKQLTLIYEEISSSSNSILEYLKIGFSDHTKVETELLISAFSKLKQVDSDTCRFKFEQIITILIDRRLDSSHSLEYLSLFAFPLNIERIPWYVKDNGERERCGLKKRFQSCYCSVIICTWDIYFYGTGTRED